MYMAGLSAKTAAMEHANRVDNGTVNAWRHQTKRRIVRLKKAGFAIAAMEMHSSSTVMRRG